MTCDHSHPWLVTILPDGTQVHAHPPLDHDVVQRLHDLSHSFVAKALGLPASPALTSGTGVAVDPELVALEEAAVLAMTAYAQAVMMVVEPQPGLEPGLTTLRGSSAPCA